MEEPGFWTKFLANMAIGFEDAWPRAGRRYGQAMAWLFGAVVVVATPVIALALLIALGALMKWISPWW